MPVPSTRRLLLVACVALGLALPAAAQESEVVYPARITTMQGRMHPIQNLGHEYGAGSFLYYDGETEGRVLWRDLDKVTFIGNLGHMPGADVDAVRKTERATLTFLDGTERQVNLVIGRLRGFDGLDVRVVPGRQVAVIDFEEVRIAPKLFKACLRGHVWEDATYRYCPFDGLTLEEKRLR